MQGSAQSNNNSLQKELLRVSRMNSNELKCALISMNVIFKKGLQPQSYYKNTLIDEINRIHARKFTPIHLSQQNRILEQSPLNRSASAQSSAGKHSTDKKKLQLTPTTAAAAGNNSANPTSSATALQNNLNNLLASLNRNSNSINHPPAINRSASFKLPGFTSVPLTPPQNANANTMLPPLFLAGSSSSPAIGASSSFPELFSTKQKNNINEQPLNRIHQELDTHLQTITIPQDILSDPTPAMPFTVQSGVSKTIPEESPAPRNSSSFAKFYQELIGMNNDSRTSAHSVSSTVMQATTANASTAIPATHAHIDLIHTSNERKQSSNSISKFSGGDSNENLIKTADFELLPSNISQKQQQSMLQLNNNNTQEFSSQIRGNSQVKEISSSNQWENLSQITERSSNTSTIDKQHLYAFSKQQQALSPDRKRGGIQYNSNSLSRQSSNNSQIYLHESSSQSSYSRSQSNNRTLEVGCFNSMPDKLPSPNPITQWNRSSSSPNEPQLKSQLSERGEETNQISQRQTQQYPERFREGGINEKGIGVTQELFDATTADKKKQIDQQQKIYQQKIAAAEKRQIDRKRYTNEYQREMSERIEESSDPIIEGLKKFKKYLVIAFVFILVYTLSCNLMSSSTVISTIQSEEGIIGYNYDKKVKTFQELLKESEIEMNQQILQQNSLHYWHSPIIVEVEVDDFYRQMKKDMQTMKTTANIRSIEKKLLRITNNENDAQIYMNKLKRLIAAKNEMYETLDESNEIAFAMKGSLNSD